MVQTTPTLSSVGEQREQLGGQLLQELEALNQALYQAGQRKSDVGVPLFPKFLTRREAMQSRLESALDTKPEALVSLGTLLRSSHPRPPVPAKGIAASLVDTGRKVEAVSLEPGNAGNGSPGRLQHWHSRGFEKNIPEVSNFPEWVEDNVDFSQKLEASAEKKGLWGWKPFRALAHVGQQKFNCLFTAHVHAIEGLPVSVNDLRLGVHFAKKDDTGVQTIPSRVFQGYAEFQETLNIRCTLHGVKNSAKGMKWESKQFILSVISLDVDELVVGRHKLDLTRLLPETIEDNEVKQDTWTTSFKLTGKAQGATLIVTFGCEIQSKDTNICYATSSSRFGELPVLRAVQSFNSLPNSGHATPSGNASEAHHSPAMSEPSAEYCNMKHLSLDDLNHESPYSAVNGSMYFDSQATTGEYAKFQRCAQSNSLSGPQTPLQAEEGTSEAAKILRYEELNVNLHAGGEEEEDDDDLEFTVVDQGIEVGTIVDTVFSRGYDAFEPEGVSVSKEKQEAESVDVFTRTEKDYGDISQEAEVLFEENEEVSKDFCEIYIDEKEDLPRGAGQDLIEELDKRVIVPEDSGIQSVKFSGVKHVSMDEDLEMQVLLAALGERELESEVGKGADTSNDLQNFHGKHERGGAVTYFHVFKDAITIDQETEKHLLELPDDMSEEELFSLIPGEVNLDSKSDEREVQSKVPESDDEFDPVAGEFLNLLESEARSSPVARTSDSEPDSPRAVLLMQFEKEGMIESSFGLNMKMAESLSSMEHSEVSDFYLHDITRDSSNDARPINEPHNLSAHQHIFSEDFNNLDWGSEEDVELASIMEAAESELQKATQTMRSKNRAKMVEDAETEALMQEWGLNKKVFEASPSKSCGDDTGHPLAVVAYDAPPLGFGLGSIVQVRDGGSLRSMNPFNFHATSGGKLVMQVSKPVVVPLNIGANSLDILMRMAAAGVDGMTDQVMMAMPLDDITGKSAEQIASEGFAAFRGNYQGRDHCGYAAIEGGHAPPILEYTQHAHFSFLAMASQRGSGMSTTFGGRPNMHKSNPDLGDDTFMSIEDLAPVAMQKIEALALEGLKIQSDMAEEEAPYLVDPLSWQERPAIEGSCSIRRIGGNSEVNSLEGVTSMRLLDGESVQGSGSSDDGFSMAISLDEWMRLDAGVVDENDTHGNTVALLATHQATHEDITPSNSGNQGGKQKGDGANDKGGLMGDTITLAMLVQLRDPLRNYEPVGAPMMALVQAERVVVPPLPKMRLGRQISLKWNNEGYDDGSDAPYQPQFKITEVTLSGLQTSDEEVIEKRKQIGWGTQEQQQSGSRWLVGSGMIKSIKHPILKSKSNAVAFSATNKITSSASKSGSLWSISTKIGSKWGAPSVSKTRNPDVAMSKTGWFGRKK